MTTTHDALRRVERFVNANDIRATAFDRDTLTRIVLDLADLREVVALAKLAPPKRTQRAVKRGRKR